MNDQQKRKLLAAAAVKPTLAAACLEAGVRRSEAVEEMSVDAEFRAAIEDHLVNSLGLAEDALFTRAVVGWDEPVFYRGERVPVRDPETGEIVRGDKGEVLYHTTRQIANDLLQVYLRAAAPERYGARPESRQTPEGDRGLAKVPRMDLSKLDAGELQQLEALLAKAAGDAE